jgi:hypothetical protein
VKVTLENVSIENMMSDGRKLCLRAIGSLEEGGGGIRTTEPHAVENKDRWSKINQLLTVIKLCSRQY